MNVNSIRMTCSWMDSSDSYHAFWGSRMFAARVKELCPTLPAAGVVDYHQICFWMIFFALKHDGHIFATASRVEGHVLSCLRNQPLAAQLGTMTTR